MPLKLNTEQEINNYIEENYPYCRDAEDLVECLVSWSVERGYAEMLVVRYLLKEDLREVTNEKFGEETFYTARGWVLIVSPTRIVLRRRGGIEYFRGELFASTFLCYEKRKNVDIEYFANEITSPLKF